MAELYRGYAPSNVARDAKYSIRRDVDGEMKVHLLYRAGHREEALLSTALHPQLVHMVNDVKLEVQGAAGGVFYINEWGHVLVKTADRQCYYAGTYREPIVFRYDEKDISTTPPLGLEPGDIWPGPHAGISYVLKADGSDIYFKHEERPRRYREHRLSDYGSAPEVQALVNDLTAHKGPGGGRIYINEARQFFAPRENEEEEVVHVYLGPLEDGQPWFPEPTVPF